MRRFAVFAGSDYYPAGGWEDFHSAYDTIEEARENGNRLYKEFNARFNWFHVVDLNIGEIVYE